MNVAPARRKLQQACLSQACPSPARLHTSVLRQHSQSTPLPAHTTPAEIDSARQYCLNLLRNYDAPSYTLHTFIPPHARDAYLALRSFNLETARISDATSNAAVGALRMQYWRDAITSSLAQHPPKEPVAILLAAAAARAPLSKTWLHRIIHTREARLTNPPFPSLADLEQYAEHTYSTLLYLTLQSLPLASLAADHIASHIGKAQGIVAVLRGLPLLVFPAASANHHHSPAHPQNPFRDPAAATTRQGTVPLPLDVMAECGVREMDVLRGGGKANGLQDAVFAVATRANDHLLTARQLLADARAGREPDHAFEHAGDGEHASLSDNNNNNNKHAASDKDQIAAAFGVFLPAVATQIYLDRLQRAQFDVFAPGLRRALDWRVPVQAYWAYSRKRF